MTLPTTTARIMRTCKKCKRRREHYIRANGSPLWGCVECDVARVVQHRQRRQAAGLTDARLEIEIRAIAAKLKIYREEQRGRSGNV